MPHAGSNQDIDFSGYVDEYRFVPLTPSLEKVLVDAVKGLGDPKGVVPMTSREIRTIDKVAEMCELARLGYLDGPLGYSGKRTVFTATSKGLRYSEEKNAYLSRKDAWARMKRSEARNGALLQVGIALLSFLGGIVCAVVGGML